MQTNLIGRAAKARLPYVNPKSKGDPEWRPGSGDAYWLYADFDVEIVGACVTGTFHSPVLIVLDGNGKPHEVSFSNVRIAPPAHPFR